MIPCQWLFNDLLIYSRCQHFTVLTKNRFTRKGGSTCRWCFLQFLAIITDTDSRIQWPHQLEWLMRRGVATSICPDCFTHVLQLRLRRVVHTLRSCWHCKYWKTAPTHRGYKYAKRRKQQQSARREKWKCGVLKVLQTVLALPLWHHVILRLSARSKCQP